MRHFIRLKFILLNCLLLLSAVLVLPVTGQAACKNLQRLEGIFSETPFIFSSQPPVIDKYELKGFFASRMLDFVPGFWVNYVKGKEKGKFEEQKKPLHPDRLKNPENHVLGCPKQTLESSLTLGHSGYVIVGPEHCFRNGKGPDILIHEPRSDRNVYETFHVHVTADRTGKGPWYEVAHDIVVDNSNNYLELELDGIVNERGVPVEEFIWIKIEDANSKKVETSQRYAGFEISAVKFLHSCRLPIGSLNRPVMVSSPHSDPEWLTPRL